MQLDDSQWPGPDKDGRQELEVRIGDSGGGAGPGGEGGEGGGCEAATTTPTHVSLATTKLTSTVQISRCSDAAALRSYYFLCQDLKSMLLALVHAHFQVQPI
jgi:protein mago nashi